MHYINLESGHPDNDGIYKVRVSEVSGIRREEQAEWIEGKGFKLIDGKLAPEEYIIEWKVNG